MSLADRIKEARLHKKITQEDLAKLLGKTKNVISNWERGDNKPDADIIFLLCELLDVEPNYLFMWESKNCISPTLEEQDYIKKLRQLDEFGKKQVLTILNNEYERCYDDVHFISYDDALDFMRSRPRYAMGGINPERMDKETLIEWANDFWRLEQKAKPYLD